MKATMILALTLTVMMSLMVSTSAQRFGQWEFFVLSTPEAECEDEVATADIRTGRIRDHLDLFSVSLHGNSLLRQRTKLALFD